MSSQEAMIEFLNRIQLLDHKKVDIKKKTGRTYKRLQAPLYFDRVVSIEQLEEAEYWTRSVPDTGNYVGNGMVSANSGKDLTSTIACAYIVYLLLCLKDPAKYYGKPSGDSIDILNIAINAQQANQVFFKGLKNRIEKCPWFQGKYSPKAGHIEFDKSINLYSGHSERESWEGYNVLVVILDEISGFSEISTQASAAEGKTADAIYKMYRASVDSRFPEFGKIVMLSFPRYKNDFIMRAYNDAVLAKEVITRTHIFKMNEDLPAETEGNELTIQWEEDHVVGYRMPGTFALKRPTWEVNPTKPIESFKHAFFRDKIEALSRFGCMPPDTIYGLFKDRDRLESTFMGHNGVNEAGMFSPLFLPRENTRYFMHVDLAKKHDRCVVAMAHVEGWVAQNMGFQRTEPMPQIIVDAIRWWTPSKENNVDFGEVRKYIVDVKQRGFDLGLVTFDRWQSDDMINYLNSVGIKSELLSVARQHYDDFVMVLHDGRLSGPNLKLLIDELSELRIMNNGRVDHPRSGSKDLADATCGAIYNAIANTTLESNTTVEVLTLDDFREPKQKSLNIIEPPKKVQIPDELKDFLAQMQLL